MMGNQHNNTGHLNSLVSRRLKIALVILVVIMVAEVVGGILSNSLALLGDAGHMLVDALALGLTLFAITIARRPPKHMAIIVWKSWRHWLTVPAWF